MMRIKRGDDMTARAKQPKALSYLFLTEMWERFGFYTIQGLLILYLTQFFGFSDDTSYSLVGMFTALVYISPILGGLAADKFLGYKISILWGGLFLILGYFLLFLPYTALFYPALGTIIIGNGLFKPNVSSVLGKQYDQNDTHRDAGFTIFYIGINIGVLLAGLSSGYVKEYFGWQICFLIASVGLVIGLLTFLLGLKYLRNTESPIPVTFQIHCELLTICALIILGLTGLFHFYSVANTILPCAGFALLIALGILTFRQAPDARKNMILLITLIISSIVFWTLFLQIFFSANLYTDRLVDKHFLGLTLTTTIFYASESVFIILLGPLFAWLWNKLSRFNKNPAPLIKFTCGVFMTGIAFLLLSYSTYFPTTQNLINPLWIFAAYFAITIGELFISPIGLAAVTKLAPANLVGIMMGVWFVATGFGGMFAGWVAKLASIPDANQPLVQKLAVYHTAFMDFALMGFAITALLLIIQLIYRKLSV